MVEAGTGLFCDAVPFVTVMMYPDRAWFAGHSVYGTQDTSTDEPAVYGEGAPVVAAAGAGGGGTAV